MYAVTSEQLLQETAFIHIQFIGQRVVGHQAGAGDHQAVFLIRRQLHPEAGQKDTARAGLHAALLSAVGHFIGAVCHAHGQDNAIGRGKAGAPARVGRGKVRAVTEIKERYLARGHGLQQNAAHVRAAYQL